MIPHLRELVVTDSECEDARAVERASLLEALDLLMTNPKVAADFSHLTNLKGAAVVCSPHYRSVLENDFLRPMLIDRPIAQWVDQPPRQLENVKQVHGLGGGAYRIQTWNPNLH